VADFGGLKKIQNGGHCHGNQGAKNVKFTPNFTKFCSNVSLLELPLQCNSGHHPTPLF
jgi:hypothetical protein